MTKRILSIILCITLLCVSVVYAAPEPELVNLAQLSTTALSASKEPSYGSTLSNGVDGVPGTFCWINGSTGDYAWYALDFGSAYELASVKLKNRPSGDSNIDYLIIEVANNEDFSDAVEILHDGSTQYKKGEGPEVDVESTEKYRYLRVRKFTSSGPMLVFSDLEVMGYVLPPELSIEKITDGDTELSNGDTLPESADYVEIDFTNTIEDSLLTENSVSVTCNDEAFPFECIYDKSKGDKLTLAFKKALAEGDSLAITLSDVTDKFTQSISDTVNFAVGSGTTSKASITLNDVISNANTMTIGGTVLSSKDKGISGRKVKLYATVPGGIEEYIAEAVSGEEGSFEFEYPVPKDCSKGIITFTVEGDYVTERAQTSIKYMGADASEVELTALSTTKASSSKTPEYGSLSGAIDGIIDTSNSGTFIYISAGGTYPWFMVDFAAPCAITSVSLVNRPSGDTNIKNIKVEVSNDPEFKDAVEIYRDETTSWAHGEGPEFSVSLDEDYRYLRVIKLKSELLCFSELTVKGYFIPPIPNVTKLSFADTEVSDGSAISRGLGHFVLDLATEIDEATLTSDNVYLLVNNEKFPIDIENMKGKYTEGKLTLKPQKSIPYGASVKLVLQDIKDVFSQDFNAEYSFSVAPVDAGLEATMLSSVKSSQNAEDIKAAFSEENYKSMGIVPVEKRGVIDDYDKFYGHFIAKEYFTVDLLADAYEEYVVLESINQAKLEGDISSILSSPVNCDLLGVSFDRIGLVDSGKTAMLEEILGLDPFDEVAGFTKKSTEIIEKYVALEAGKTDIQTVDNTCTIYDGQGAELELAFLNEETSVSAVKFVLTSTNEASLSDASVELDIEGTYEKAIEDGVLTINIIPIRTVQKAQHFGTVTLTVPADSSAYNVTVSGTVTYNATLRDEKTFVTTNIIPKTSTISFTQNSSSGTGGKTDTSTSRPSAGFGGGGNGGITVAPITPVTPNTNRYFTDLTSSAWAEEAVNALTEKGIISKNEDGMFYPEIILTREEFVKLIVEALDLYDAEAKSEFTDVSDGSWYAPYVASAYKAGFVTGRDDGTFGSGDSITREDMAVMLMRACKFNESTSSQFEDDTEIADYAKTAVYTLKSLGIINGTSETSFSPKANATRAMAAKVIYEMLKEVA